jgi:site-specific DNA-methyltransferase (adenine-specific)
MSEIKLILGDCFKVLDSVEDSSVHAIVTDPPYGLGFMNCSWDQSVPTSGIFAKLRRVAKPGAHLLCFGGTKLFHKMATAIENGGWEPRDVIVWAYGQGMPKSHGTLKPAVELISIMRKPFTTALAVNLETYGVGDLNVDECLVDTRHPANLVHDGSAEVVDFFPLQKSGANPIRRGSAKFKNCYSAFEGQEVCVPRRGTDSGSAARFFYCAKANKQEREGNIHPTVKPIDLLCWLIRLVAKPGQIVLDPFMGSGTTGVACKREGVSFIGIEQEEQYIKIAKERIAR